MGDQGIGVPWCIPWRASAATNQPIGISFISLSVDAAVVGSFELSRITQNGNVFETGAFYYRLQAELDARGALCTYSLLADIDGDSLSDFHEVNYDGNSTSHTLGANINPLVTDSDGDQFGDGMEDASGYDPLNGSDFPVWGDINDDRVVDTADVLLASRAVLGLITLTSDQLIRGNVAPLINSHPQPALNGGFNAADLLLITRKAMIVNAF